MMFSESPCKDCTGRYIGCHNDNACPAWRDWKAEEKRKNEELGKALQAERAFQAMQSEKDARISRRMRGRRAR